MTARARRLFDIGSTTALSAMVEIVETAKQARGNASGLLARQAKAMLARLQRPDQEKAIEGFCDELQAWIESVPGARKAFSLSKGVRRASRIAERAA
jgi:hypothetical protein